MKMNMKVANIIEEGRLGGPQVRIARISENLKKKFNIETTVIYPFRNSKRFRKRLDENEIKYIQMPLNPLSREPKAFLRYVIYFFYELFLIYRLLKKEKFDLVHVSGGVWQIKGIIAGRLAGCKVIWHLNDTHMPLILKWTAMLVSKQMAAGLIVAGKRVKDYYQAAAARTGKPVFEIQAPVDTAFFRPGTISEKRNVLNPSGINILSVGNINPVKGFEDFIRMAENLKDQSGLNFYIAGSPLKTQTDYFNDLCRLKRKYGLDNVFFLGGREDIREILAQTDIYVCSSKNEASPLSVWEAMSMEKAVVSFDVGDVSRFVLNGRNGFVVPCCRPDLLAEKVKILIRDPGLRKKMGHKARKTAKDFLDTAIISKKHRNAYIEVLRSGAG